MRPRSGRSCSSAADSPSPARRPMKGFDAHHHTAPVHGDPGHRRDGAGPCAGPGLVEPGTRPGCPGLGAVPGLHVPSGHRAGSGTPGRPEPGPDPAGLVAGSRRLPIRSGAPGYPHHSPPGPPDLRILHQLLCGRWNLVAAAANRRSLAHPGTPPGRAGTPSPLAASPPRWPDQGAGALDADPLRPPQARLVPDGPGKDRRPLVPGCLSLHDHPGPGAHPGPSGPPERSVPRGHRPGRDAG